MKQFTFKESRLAKTVVVLAMSGSLLGVNTPAHAIFSFGGVNGATETTQWANFGQLLAMAKDTVMTVKNTLDTVQHVKSALENLPQAFKDFALDSITDQLTEVGDLMVAVDQAAQAYDRLGERSQFNESALKLTNLSPMEFLKARARLAAGRGGYYKAQLDLDRQLLENAKKRSRDLQTALQANREIMSPTGAGTATANMMGLVASAANEQLNLMARAQQEVDQERMIQMEAQAQAANRDASLAKAAKEAPPQTLNFDSPQKGGLSTKSVMGD